MQNAVKNGHQQHAPAKQEQNAAVQGVKARKQLARIGGHDTRRPHAPQNHGGVEKGIDPRHHMPPTLSGFRGDARWWMGGLLCELFYKLLK